MAVSIEDSVLMIYSPLRPMWLCGCCRGEQGSLSAAAEDALAGGLT